MPRWPSILRQDLARVRCRKDRLQPTGDVAGKQADCAGRRDCDQMAVADAMDCYSVSDVLGKGADERPQQVLVAFVVRKAALFPGKRGGGTVGGVRDQTH